MKRISINLLLQFFLLSFISTKAIANLVQEGFVITDPSHKWLELVKQQPDLTIDHVRGSHFEVWGPVGLEKWLTKNKANFSDLNTLNIQAVNGFPTHEENTAQLQDLAKAYPTTAKLFSIGKSVQGRDLWVIKISRHVNTDDNRPEFKYIANMHGDEIVGRELMMKLILDLLQKDGTDAQITELLDKVQIYIMPSMNPDGAALKIRGTAKSIDLNRDFPDFNSNDNVNSPNGRAAETQAVMNWQATRNFKLSANFHGGSEVVNYPWDAIAAPHPLETYLKNISLNYAHLAPYIAASTEFENGITNGFAWYQVLGGMQDWSYHWYNDIQLTIELSNAKWPNYSTVNYYWEQNRPALINLITQVTFL